MCVEIEIMPDGPTLENVGDARRFLGEIIMDGDYETPRDECCLCGVDCEAMLRRAGYVARRGPWGWEGRKK